jgi:hypothetical protein
METTLCGGRGWQQSRYNFWDCLGN